MRKGIQKFFQRSKLDNLYISNIFLDYPLTSGVWSVWKAASAELGDKGL